MTPKEVLIAAKALIDTPDKWTQGVYEDDGRFCALGAVYEFTKWRPDPALDLLHQALPSRWKNRDVTQFNDSRWRKHADIMALFDRAIEAAS